MKKLIVLGAIIALLSSLFFIEAIIEISWLAILIGLFCCISNYSLLSELYKTGKIKSFEKALNEASFYPAVSLIIVIAINLWLKQPECSGILFFLVMILYALVKRMIATIKLSKVLSLPDSEESLNYLMKLSTKELSEEAIISIKKKFSDFYLNSITKEKDKPLRSKMEKENHLFFSEILRIDKELRRK